MLQVLKDRIAISMVSKGKKRLNILSEMELKHSNDSIKGFNDSSYFAGLSSDGISFVSRLAFRVDKPNENWLKIFIPGEGVWGFENKQLTEGDGFKQGSLEYKCIVPGKKWAINFDGVIENGLTEENLKLKLIWESAYPIIDFDTVGTTARQVGKQIAAAKWDSSFFNKLKELKQVHYEQSGKITGTVFWKNKNIEVDLKGVRDHSWGVRNWDDWDRHFWFLGMLDDGRFFNFSQISYSFVKSLKAGFICKNEQQKTVFGIPSFEEINFDSLFPKKIRFQIEEEKGLYVPLSINMKTFFPFKMDDVYYIRQAASVFEYNGVKGIGIAEMGANMKKYNIDIASTC
ncbi:MAG TPA: hypothetical protein VIN10_00015 [Bacteroidales bacterium]